ncbi:MAG: glycosyltransferase family 39 protein [Chloroflexota bacterium]|nr:glycosyltransferase family 39 protein [Chloroflexota bacterium]
MAWGIIAVGTLVRLAYGLAVNDPMSGPDANGYEPQAQVLAAHGVLTNVCSLVDRHAGYPLVIAAVYDVFGVHQRAFVAVQALLFGLGSFFAYTLARRELGTSVGLVALSLLTLSPALLASSTEFMYEPLFGIGLVAGLDLISRALRAPPWRAVALTIGGGALLGLSTALHPKALAVALPVAAALVLLHGGRTRLVLPVCCLLGVALAPAALAARTAAAGGEVNLGSQFGTSMFRYNPVNDPAGTPTRKGPSQRPASARGTKPCIPTPEAAAAAAARPPSAAARRPPEQDESTHAVVALAGKFRDFWGPMVPPAALGQGTWFHGLNGFRLAPSAVAERSWFEPLATAGQYLWSVLGLALVIGGGWLVLTKRSRRWKLTVFYILPVVVFLAVSLYTVAEARFRLPVAPFYVGLQAVALLALGGMVRKSMVRRSNARDDASLPASSAER